MSNGKVAVQLSKEVVGYTLSPASPKSQSTSHAAIVNLHHINASSPVIQFRGTTPSPSSSSLTIISDGENTFFGHSDTSRPLIHLHIHQSVASTSTCPLSARLHPPETISALAVSPDGTLLASGSASGRLYIWHLASGIIVASLDAHFRSVTCIKWTACGMCLITASDDARILVWSVAALSDEGNRNPTPYAIFADHVQPVTCIQLSSSAQTTISTFPSSTRLLSSSLDGTVKLWDVLSRSLVATWTFGGPVSSLAVESGFRAFFVAVRSRLEVEDEVMVGASAEDGQTSQDWDMIRRVDLYGINSEASVSTSFNITRARGKIVWRPNGSTTRITALALSTTGSHLLIGTSEAHLYVVDVASSLMIRSATLVPTGNATSDLSVSGLQTFLLQDTDSLLSGSMKKASSSNHRWPVCDKLQRTNENESVLHMRISSGRAGEIASLLVPPSLAGHQRLSAPSFSPSTSSSAKGEQLQAAQRKIEKLEADNEKLNDLLRRAQKTNTSLWERVVKETMDTK